jgi:hypothetical protein
MKVFFLGAGASHKAGYPLASGLLEALRSEAERTRSINGQQGWAIYEKFVERTQGPLRRVLQSPNPEVAFTLLDLLGEARESEEQAWLKQLKPSTEEDVLERVKNPPRRNEPKEFADVEVALRGLLDSLVRYFWWKHVQDQPPEAAHRWAYLSRELEGLKPGDVVITTNWDTLLERVLLDAGLWTPTDGYGFDVDLVTYRRREALPESFRDSSAVKLLKLHGSFGWYLDRQNSIYLSRARFLQHLPLRHGTSEVLCEDRAEPLNQTSTQPRALVYPTYLKRLEYPQLQAIWSRASTALRDATEFHAIGYSLPLSDTAIRVLLNPLRGRHERGEARILVEDPDPGAQGRWKTLLGEDIDISERSIGSCTG